MESAEYNKKEALIMTEKEFRKLKALELIQLLLTQSNEVSAQQEELDLLDVRLESFKGENDVIKAKLNDRDAMTELIKQKLNESDERIRELEKEVKSLYSNRIIELEEAGSLVQAALELNKIFEAAQKEAERYMYGAERGIEGRRYHAVGVTDRFEEPQRTEPAGEQPGLRRETAERRRQPGAEEKPMTEEKPMDERPAAEESIAEKLKDEELINEAPINEEPINEEPAIKPVEPEDPPGLEAFNWRPEEDLPLADQLASQKEEPPKEPEPSREPETPKPRGLFSWLFGRRKK